MHTESTEPRAVDGSQLERAIILQLLREDCEPKWSRTELATELGAEAVALDVALQALGEDGVVCHVEERVWASRAARRLDELELIGI